MPANEQDDLNESEPSLARFLKSPLFLRWQSQMAASLSKDHAKLYEFLYPVMEKDKDGTNVSKVREKKEGMPDPAGRCFAFKRVHMSAAAAEIEQLKILTQHTDDIVAYIGNVPCANAKDFVYIQLKWFESKPLNEHLRNLAISNGSVADEYCLDIAEQILKSINYIHERNVVHRDIKPDNFLVSRDGKVKMNDLGLARLAESKTALSAGAVGYRAPEAAKKRNSIYAANSNTQSAGSANSLETKVMGAKVDKASDIFSTGVMLYELFSGDLADGIPSLPHSLAPLWRHDPQDDTKYLPENEFNKLFVEAASENQEKPAYQKSKLLHAETKDVEKKRALLDKSIRRCLKYNPADRYRSAETLRVDVRIAFNPNWIYGEKGIDTAFDKSRSPEKLEAICEAYSQIVAGCKTNAEYLADSEVLRERNEKFANYLSDIIKGLSANLLQGAKPDRYWPEKDSQIYHEAVKLIASKYPKTDELKSMKVQTVSCADLSDFGKIFANSQYAAILSVFGKMKVQNGA
jgi:serine/threonine protein kinase